jgi:adenylosuccinate lyase
MKVWDENRDFESLLAEDPEIQRVLNSAELSACFDLKHELRHVDAVFDRVLNARGGA